MATWFDLGDQKIKLYFAGIGKSANLVIMGAVRDSREWDASIDLLGFTPSPTGAPLLLKKFVPQELSLAYFQKAFKHAKKITIDSIGDVRLQTAREGANLSGLERALNAAMTRAKLIGMNAVGQRVFQSPTGERFIVSKEGAEVREADLPSASLALRCDGEQSSVNVCAQGFVAGIVAGMHAEVSDVSRFVDTIFAEPVLFQDQQARVARVEMAIEKALLGRLIKNHSIAGDTAFREAQLMFENAPALSTIQTSPNVLPLPLSIALQECLGAFKIATKQAVYVPSIENASLVSMLGDGFAIHSELPEVDSLQASVRQSIPDHVGVADRAEHEKVVTHRVSILHIANFSDANRAQFLSDLKKRTDYGLTVVTFPASESPDGMEGFIRSLDMDYKFFGHAVIAPVLRRKLQKNVALHVICFGAKYSQKEKQLLAEDWIPFNRKPIYTWDELRSFTNDVLLRVHEFGGHKLTPEEEISLRANELVENNYQMPYQSFSENGKVELMIPRNLAAATYRALQKVGDRVGNVDQYVKNAIGFNEEQFAYLAPEQVDAAALMVAAADRGAGFVLGDQTGAGKGVTLATTVAHAWSRGIPVLFVTKQDNLFSDFYRDLKKVGLHEQMRPLIINHDSVIVDQFSDSLDRVASGVSRKEFLANFRFGLEGFGNPNIVFSTYSQFNGGVESQKSEWALNIAKNAVVIFDEAHIAAGDSSQLGEVCCKIAIAARSVVYSSATWLKDARQTTFYQRALPKSIDAKMVANAIDVGGEAVQETFTSMLAEDGLFIRRERDSSELEIQLRLDEKRVAENESIANNVSVILQGLQRLCGVTDQVGRRLTRTQMDKLDAAQRVIDTAMKRAQENLTTLIQSGNTVQANQHVDTVTMAPTTAETNFESELVEVASHVNALTERNEIAEQYAVETSAAVENEDFIATGQTLQVAPLTRSMEDPGAADVDWSLADLGLEQGFFISEHRRPPSLSVADGKDYISNIKKDLSRLKQMRRGVSTRTSSFGSFLFLTQRTLNVALQARFAADCAIEAIENGQKPVIFLEQTFETALSDAVLSPDTIKEEDGTFLIAPLTLKDNLRSQYKSIVRITHVDAEGTSFDGTVLDSTFHANPEEKRIVEEGLLELSNLIDALPDDLYCSPFDTIASRIRAAGYTVGEASGRKLKVIEEVNGKWRIGARRRDESKISVVERGFNNGSLDALIGNKAMSTGLSIHASREFADQRQRVSFFAQIFSDINDYMQAIGRTDRRGQIMPPLMVMLASGLPSETRVMMNHYGKLRKLLASSTSNRSSKLEVQSLPDLFNSTGDRSVCEFMQANPGVPVRLGIDFKHFMPPGIDDGKEIYINSVGLAKFTLARLDLLPVAEARNVNKEIDLNYEEIVRELDAHGMNPFKTNVVDLTTFSETKESVEDLLPSLMNNEGYVSSVFDEAVELRTYVCKSKMKAKEWQEILCEIERSSRRLFIEDQVEVKAGREAIYTVHDDKAVWPAVAMDGPLNAALKLVPSGLRKRVEKMFDVSLVLMQSSEAARKSAGVEGEVHKGLPMSPIQILQRRKQWLLGHLSDFMPGKFIKIVERGHFGITHSRYGVVTDLIVPKPGRETNFSRWGVTVHFAGYQQSHHYTLRELFQHSIQSEDQWLPGILKVKQGMFETEVCDVFDQFQENDYTTSRYVFTGNLFRAASIAAESRLGVGGVLKVDGHLPQRIIAMGKGVTRESIYAAVPVQLTKEDVVSVFTRTIAGLDDPPSKSRSYWQDFLKMNIASRGVHSSKESDRSALSFYWMPAKLSIVEGVSERFLGEVDETDSASGDEAPSEGLLAGVAVRIDLENVSFEQIKAIAGAMNDEFEQTCTSVRKSAFGGSARLLIKFKGDGCVRDDLDQMRAKISAFINRVYGLVDVPAFYVHSPQMRLLSLAVTEERRANLRELRSAAEEVKAQRNQLGRLKIGATEPEDAASVNLQGADDIEDVDYTEVVAVSE